MRPQVWKRRQAGGPVDSVPYERWKERGKPFLLGDHGPRAQVIEKYREWLLSQPEMLERVKAQLQGKHLVCCCKPKPCHGDVLLALANYEQSPEISIC